MTLASSTAVCAQTAWIQSTTIRNNIVFGNVFDPERYRYVLDKCCLLPDLATLAEGDQTIVGEKGVSLSGGQKQRLNIARALYHNSEIVLLDDCLSALDARVGADIFANVIAGPAMQGKTRLLVTHSLNVLRSCDWLVYMENGRIAEQGTYDELVGSKSRVAELVLKHTKDQNDQSKDEVGESSEGDPDARAGSILGSHPEDNLARLRKDGGASSISSTVTMEDDRKPDLSSDRSDKEVEKKTENEVKSKALMQDEERSSGSVSRATYLSYLNAAPLSVLLPLFVLAVLVFQGSTIMSPVWLMWWQRGTFGLQQGVYMGV